jgi:hypothetical protein
MVENITNLTNTTILVDTLEVMKNFASGHLEAIIVIVGSSGVVGLVFKGIIHRRIGKKRLKDHLEQFVSCWEDDKKGGDKVKLRMKMSEIGNELKEVVRDIERPILPFPQKILDDARTFADEIILFSGKGLVVTVGSDELSNLIDQRNQERDEEGDKLAERAKELIKKL